MSGIDVFGLGTLATDVLIRVDHLPAADGFCVVKSSTKQPGGSGTNVIVQLARLGDACSYAGEVGDDALGHAVLDSLADEGVDTTPMVVRPDGETLHTDIVIADGGEKFIMLNLGDAFAALTSADVDLEQLRHARVLYTDLLPKEPALAVLTAAREEGVTTVVNVQVDLMTCRDLASRPPTSSPLCRSSTCSRRAAPPCSRCATARIPTSAPPTCATTGLPARCCSRWVRRAP